MSASTAFGSAGAFASTCNQTDSASLRQWTIFDPTSPIRGKWMHLAVSAKATSRGGIIRRAVRDVKREIARETLVFAVWRCGWHMVESGGQFIVLCNTGKIKLIFGTLCSA